MPASQAGGPEFKNHYCQKKIKNKPPQCLYKNINNSPNPYPKPSDHSLNEFPAHSKVTQFEGCFY
jgi:hypothetical protein